MGSLPAPRTNEAEENISHYLLVIIDELETLVELLSEDTIEEFNVTGFSSHAATLDTTYTLLSSLLTGLHSKGYQDSKNKDQYRRNIYGKC
jgi:hypothetical protein